MSRSELDPIRPGDVEAMKELYANLRRLGSFNPSADFQVLMQTDRIRHLPAVELYRCLMEPVFRWRPSEQGMAVTVFRTLRAMYASEVYNWLRSMRCYPASFDDVAVVLDKARVGEWRVFLSSLPGRRLFYPDPDTIYDEMMPSGRPCSFEYVYIPESAQAEGVLRADYRSRAVTPEDLIIAWNFPEDPIRQWHDPSGIQRNPEAEKLVRAEAARMGAITQVTNVSPGLRQAVLALAHEREVPVGRADIERASATLRALASGVDFTPEELEQTKAILEVMSEATLRYAEEIMGPVVQ